MARNKTFMKKQLFNALEVTPPKPYWTVLVQVLEKHITKESRRNKDMKYKNYVLLDMQNTKIPAITFTPSNEHVARLLVPFKRYYISNAQVADNEPKYRLGEYAYKWVLSNKTLIEPIHDTVPRIIPCEFQFVKFSEFHKIADQDVSIDVKALVVHSYAVHNASNNAIKEYIVVDETKKLMILQLWEDLLDNEDVQVSDTLPNPTLIVGRNLKVTTHNGMSLTTKTNPYFMVDPPLEIPDPLIEWYHNNATEISQLLAEQSYLDTEKLFPPPNVDEIMPLNEVVTTIDVIKTAWVSASVHLVPAQESLWYSVCEKCKKYVNAKIGWDIICSSCGQPSSAIPHSRMDIFLNDTTATICTTVYGKDVEKMISLTAKELQEEHEKNPSLMKNIEEKIYKKEVVCLIRYFERVYGGKSERKYPIQQLYTLEEFQNHCNTLDTAAVVSDIELITELGSPRKTIEEKQFFTPTTMKVVEEIAMSTTSAAATTCTTEHTKRSLTFGLIDSGHAEEGLDKKTAMLDNTVMDAPATESPVKKSKNTEVVKEKQS